MELIVALDYPKVEQAEALISDIGNLPVIYKVGFELFLDAGPKWVRAKVTQGHRLFLDLKFHDIPNTVSNAVKQAERLGVEMTTLHLSGGSEMLKKAKEAKRASIPRHKGAPTSPGNSLKPSLRLLGVSVLTSFDEASWGETCDGILGTSKNEIPASSIKESVMGLVDNGKAWIDGVVCSGKEIESVKAISPDLFVVVPGVRPEGSPEGDQKRVLTPLEVKKLGGDAIVVGRPITLSPNPKKVVEGILDEC